MTRTAPPAPSFAEALRFWWKLGWISFGGPAGQIAIMHKEIVERRRWLSEEHFLHALNFCMLLPVLAAGWLLGWRSIQFQEGLFFSKAALVTIGGAYAVLPYVAQMAVEQHGWLAQKQMMAGLGLAETTPGPLIMVLQFVGFVAAWQNPGNLSPLLAGTLGALITTWVTFLPCFLFVFLGAPHVEGLRERPALASTLTAITAAVVGVILNLAIWFAWHALRPEGGGFDSFVAVMALASWIAMEKFKTGVIPTLAACAVLGMIVKIIGWA